MISDGTRPIPLSLIVPCRIISKARKKKESKKNSLSAPHGYPANLKNITWGQRAKIRRVPTGKKINQFSAISGSTPFILLSYHPSLSSLFLILQHNTTQSMRIMMEAKDESGDDARAAQHASSNTEAKAAAEIGNTAAAAGRFPSELYRMLDTVASKGMDGLVCWQEDGKSFMIHDKPEFERVVMPM